MKKTITIALILLLIPIVYAQDDITEPQIDESYKPSTNGIGYFIKTIMPEFFIGIGKFFDKDERVNWKLQQLEKRRAEYEYILEKLQETQSEENKKRYESIIRVISKRQEQNLKKLERYASLLKKEKKDKVNQILGKREEILNGLKTKFADNLNALEGINKALNSTNKIRQKLQEIQSTQVIIGENGKIIKYELDE